MESPDVVVRMRGVVLGYGQHTVVQEVNLEVRAGEFWFILGPNGGGKTTLLRAFLRLLRPQAGELWVHPELGRRERVGFVPQRCNLIPTLPVTVREFVLLGLVGISAHREEERERLARALDIMGLQGLAGQSYWTLSGGQRQRALVARALIRRPTLLVLDEPTSGLDVATEDSLLRTLTAANQTAHRTVLFATHSLPIALRHATHAALVLDGRVIAGPRQAVLTERNLAQLYGLGTCGPPDPGAPSVVARAARGESA
ncbi:MAG: ABC transporter ATP-binding protein [Thermodesulfobacteriota bacterium]|jgi:ABC-type Mn2+/Zn2+ transport system ATPase subunit